MIKGKKTTEKPTNPRKIKEYCLYRGDEFVDVGTVREMAKRLKMKEHTIRTYKSENWKKRNPRGITLYDLEEDK